MIQEGGRPTHYVFWTQADVSGTTVSLYNDMITAGTSSKYPALGNAVTFSSTQKQAGGDGTTPSINTWGDTGLSLKFSGNTVNGVGLTAAPTTSGIGSVVWALSTDNTYDLLTFDLAPDGRWTSGFNDGAMYAVMVLKKPVLL